MQREAFQVQKKRNVEITLSLVLNSTEIENVSDLGHEA